MTGENSTQRVWQLLEILGDGAFHSGEALAGKMGLSRASVFNETKKLEGLGIGLQRIRGKGYRLARPWEKLSKTQVAQWLGHERDNLDLDVLLQADSSNSVMLRRSTLGAPSGSVVAVELQTQGRGRQGRPWHSGLGSGLTFSMLWRFDCGLNALSGLSLAVGVALIRALEKCGAEQVKLKWPNDILTEHGKLGGVLIESQGDMLGPSAVVIGIGLNYTLPDNVFQKIDQPSSSIEEVCAVMPSRNRLLAESMKELASVLREFAEGGFSTLCAEWQRHHAYQNRPIRLRMPNGSQVEGVAIGVSKTGELRLRTAQGEQLFNSGEVGGAVK